MVVDRSKNTSQLVFGKLLEVQPVTTDRYGRTVALVRVENITVNDELIKEDSVWVCQRHCRLKICNDSW